MIRAAAALGLAAVSVPCLAGPVTIRYACTDGAESIPYINQICAEFEASHPNIHVKVEPVVSGVDYKNKLLAMYAANIAPDVVRMGQADWTAFAVRDALIPLNRFLDGSPEVKLQDYYPNTVKYFSLDGKLWVLPRAISSDGLVYYNKRLLREAGLPDPDGSWTWDFDVRPSLGVKDFFYCVQKLTKRNGNTVTQYGYATSWPQLWMDTLLRSSGLSLWNDDSHPTRMTATEPDVEKVFMLASDTVNKFHWLPSGSDLTTNNSNVHDEFVKGHLAMFQSGAWECKKLREEMKDPWDVTVVPSFRNEPLRTPGELTGTAIFSSTAHPQECWEFVKWMSGPHGMIPLAKAGLDQPAIRSLAESAYWLPPGVPPAHLAVTDTAGNAVTLHPTPEYFDSLLDLCGGTQYDVLTGAGDPVDKLRDLEAKGQTRLDAILRKQSSSVIYPFGPALACGLLIAAVGIGWIYWPERRRRLTKIEKKESRSAYWFLVPWILGAAMTFGPMIYSLLLSFSDSDIIRTPHWLGFGNYIDAFDASKDDSLLISLRVTFTYCLLSVPLGIVTALGLALLLNQKVRGVAVWRALYYVPSLAGGVAIALIWMKVFNPETGLLNSLIYGADGHRNLLGIGSLLSNLAGTPDKPVNWIGNPHTVLPAFVIMGLWGAGGGTIIFLAGLQGISPTYYEAATLDGAGAIRRFTKVTIPLLTPTLFFAFVTGVIGALQAFSQAFVMTDGGPDRATLFYVLYLYKEAFGHLHMGFACALAWILFAIILAITALQLWGSKRWVHYEGGLT